MRGGFAPTKSLCRNRAKKQREIPVPEVDRHKSSFELTCSGHCDHFSIRYYRFRHGAWNDGR